MKNVDDWEQPWENSTRMKQIKYYLTGDGSGMKQTNICTRNIVHGGANIQYQREGASEHELRSQYSVNLVRRLHHQIWNYNAHLYTRYEMVFAQQVEIPQKIRIWLIGIVRTGQPKKNLNIQLRNSKLRGGQLVKF